MYSRPSFSADRGEIAIPAAPVSKTRRSGLLPLMLTASSRPFTRPGRADQTSMGNT